MPNNEIDSVLLPGITRQVLAEIVDGIKVSAEALALVPSEVIAGLRDCWNLKDDDGFGYSTKAMSDEELQQAIIEDLLLVKQWRNSGKEVGGDFAHLVRFLDDESRARVAEQINSPMVKSLIAIDGDGKVEIAHEHMQDAMDFAGMWLDGWDMLAEGPFISVSPQFR